MNVLVKYVRGVEFLVRGLGIASMYLLLVILAVLMFPVFARGGEISTIWALETAQFAVGAYYILGAGWSLQQNAPPPPPPPPPRLPSLSIPSFSWPMLIHPSNSV